MKDVEIFQEMKNIGGKGMREREGRKKRKKE